MDRHQHQLYINDVARRAEDKLAAKLAGSGPTPADTLRAAATKLRNAANLHGDPGPWLVHQCRGFLRVGPNIPPAHNGWKLTRGADLPEERRDTAEYIALMHPGVGLALAAWLSSAAEDAEQIGPDPDALATARAILGEVAE